MAALLALAANLLDVMLGFGETDPAGYGAKTATEWWLVCPGLVRLSCTNIFQVGTNWKIAALPPLTAQPTLPIIERDLLDLMCLFV